MSVLSPVSRSFTREESSAIANIQVDHLNVSVAWHNNPAKSYEFVATEEFADDLIAVLESPALEVSMGRLIDAARKSGNLQEVQG
jgi:hypothetical protein